MKKEKIVMIDGGNKFSLEVKKLGYLSMGLGLMFSRRGKADALLFEFDKDVGMKIHSMFVFYPFLAIWLDAEDKVIEKKIVEPWKLNISSPRKFRKLVEIPISRRYSKVLGFIVGEKFLSNL